MVGRGVLGRVGEQPLCRAAGRGVLGRAGHGARAQRSAGGLPGGLGLLFGGRRGR